MALSGAEEDLRRDVELEGVLALGRVRFDAGYHRGRTLSPDAAIEVALASMH
jgi:hypothetical protein